MFKVLAFIGVLVLASCEAGPYNGKVLRAVPETQKEVDDLKSLEDYGLEVDFWQAPSAAGKNVDIYIHEQNLTAVVNLLNQWRIKYKIMIGDVQYAVDNENPPQSRAGGFSYDRYNRLQDIYAEMKRLASQYSNMAELVSTGKSYEGREQLAIKITSPNSNSNSKKTFFINCGIHAREWVTPATCMYMIRQMLTEYSRDSSVKATVDKMNWIIMPSLNPDGYEYTWQRNRMWRRTRTRHGGCIGADPNRNWNYKWGGVGTSSRCSDTYHGPYPFSEVETYNVAKYLFKIRRNLVGYMDIHAYSQLWMTPWGYKRAHPNDNGEQVRVGNEAARALQNVHGTSYKVGPSSIIIYATSGATDDWTYGFLGLPYSYALELRDTGRYGFLLPADQIIPTGEETFAGIQEMAREMKI